MYICICIFCVYIYIYHHLLKLFLKIMLPSQRAHKIGTPKLDVAVVAASPFPTSNVSSKPLRLTPTASHLDSKACEKSMTSEVSLRRFCCNFIVHVCGAQSQMCHWPMSDSASNSSLAKTALSAYARPKIRSREIESRRPPKKTKYPVVVFVLRVGTCTNNIT